MIIFLLLLLAFAVTAAIAFAIHLRSESPAHRSTRSPSIAWGITVAAVILFIITLFAGGIVSVYVKVCDDTGSHLDLPVEFSVWSGCYLVIDGELVPYDLYRIQESL